MLPRITYAYRGQSSAKERGQQHSSRVQDSKQCAKLQRTAHMKHISLPLQTGFKTRFHIGNWDWVGEE